MGEESRRIGKWDGKCPKQSFVSCPDLSFSLSLGGEDGMREDCCCCLPFCTDTCNGSSIKLPVLAQRLLTTVRISAPLWSCLATQGPQKKAKEPDRKGQREGGLPEEQRALSAGSKCRAASQVLRISPPQSPGASYPLFCDWQATTADIFLLSHLSPLKCKSSGQGCPTSVWKEFIRPSERGEKAKCGKAVLSSLCFPL